MSFLPSEKDPNSDGRPPDVVLSNADVLQGKESYAGWYAWDEATREWVPHPDPEAGYRVSEEEIRAPLYDRKAEKRRNGPRSSPFYRRR